MAKKISGLKGITTNAKRFLKKKTIGKKILKEDPIVVVKIPQEIEPVEMRSAFFKRELEKDRRQLFFK